MQGKNNIKQCKLNITFYTNGKATYNWKFIHRYLQHLEFCWQYSCILVGYNIRIRHFWYLVSYIFCFSFYLLFYLDGMFTVEKYKLLLPRLVKNNMHQTNTFLWWIPMDHVFSNQMCEKTFEEEIWNNKYKHISLCMFLRDIVIL